MQQKKRMDEKHKIQTKKMIKTISAQKIFLLKFIISHQNAKVKFKKN